MSQSVPHGSQEPSYGAQIAFLRGIINDPEPPLEPYLTAWKKELAELQAKGPDGVRQPVLGRQVGPARNVPELVVRLDPKASGDARYIGAPFRGNRGRGSSPRPPAPQTPDPTHTSPQVHTQPNPHPAASPSPARSHAPKPAPSAIAAELLASIRNG